MTCGSILIQTNLAITYLGGNVVDDGHQVYS